MILVALHSIYLNRPECLPELLDGLDLNGYLGCSCFVWVLESLVVDVADGAVLRNDAAEIISDGLDGTSGLHGHRAML